MLCHLLAEAAEGSGAHCVGSREVRSADAEQGCVLPVAALVPALPSLCFRFIIICTPPGGLVLEKVILVGTSSLLQNPQACDFREGAHGVMLAWPLGP